MGITLIIQARMGSTRLAGKSLMRINNKILVDLVISRCLKVSNVGSVYLATTILPEDDALVDHVKKNSNVDIYRGDPLDVRSRFSDIAKREKSNFIIRITGDDPFKDPNQISSALDYLISNKLDYICNFEPRCLPIGMDYEIFTRESLENSITSFDSQSDKEHVTWSMRSAKFKWHSVVNPIFQPTTRLTIDYKHDLDYCAKLDSILETFNADFSWESTKKAIQISSARSS